MLRSFYIKNIRNLVEGELECGERFNWFIGNNGAGKTSILESLSLLFSTKSFRTNRPKVFLANHADSGFVRGCLSHSMDVDGDSDTIAVLKSKLGETTYRVNGRTVSAGDYIQTSPTIQVLAPEAANLFEDGAQERRRFLDWGVFHVKHDFLTLWRSYNRLLKQRNVALREHRLDKLLIKSIDQQLVPEAEKLSDVRKNYWEEFYSFINGTATEELESILSDEEGPTTLKGFELRYRCGWAAGKSLSDVLSDGLKADHRLGFTQSGPHRADFQILFNGIPALDLLSRGQKKIFHIWFKILQSKHIHMAYDKNTFFLVDDLGAELDLERSKWAYAQIASMANQVFATATAIDLSIEPYLSCDSPMFHVKHGRIIRD